MVRTRDLPMLCTSHNAASRRALSQEPLPDQHGATHLLQSAALPLSHRSSAGIDPSDLTLPSAARHHYWTPHVSQCQGRSNRLGPRAENKKDLALQNSGK